MGNKMSVFYINSERLKEKSLSVAEWEGLFSRQQKEDKAEILSAFFDLFNFFALFYSC